MSLSRRLFPFLTRFVLCTHPCEPSRQTVHQAKALCMLAPAPPSVFLEITQRDVPLTQSLWCCHCDNRGDSLLQHLPLRPVAATYRAEVSKITPCTSVETRGPISPCRASHLRLPRTTQLHARGVECTSPRTCALSPTFLNCTFPPNSTSNVFWLFSGRACDHQRALCISRHTSLRGVESMRVTDLSLRVVCEAPGPSSDFDFGVNAFREGLIGQMLSLAEKWHWHDMEHGLTPHSVSKLAPA